MNETEQKNRLPGAEGAKAAVKKPYVKPEVRFEKVFETRALSCGKVETTQRSCKQNRRSS